MRECACAKVQHAACTGGERAGAVPVKRVVGEVGEVEKGVGEGDNDNDV